MVVFLLLSKYSTVKNNYYIKQCSQITSSGEFFVHTNHNSKTKKSYITLWCLKTGSLLRRLLNESKAIAMAISSDARRVLYLTDNKKLKIWDPFR